MDIFVGSLPFKMNEAELQIVFEAFGEVKSVKIVIDKATRQNKGFGFVEMPDLQAAKKAIAQLNGSDQGGRAIVVSEAQKDKSGERIDHKPKDWFKKKRTSTKNIIKYGDNNPL